MAKDWVGGSAAVFKTLGASNHADGNGSMRTITLQNQKLRSGFAGWNNSTVEYWNLHVAKDT